MNLEDMTKFEKARLIGARALQISMGAPLLANPKGINDPITLAEKEVQEKKLPITIHREMPKKREAM